MGMAQWTPRLPQDSRAYPRTAVPTPGQWTPRLPQDSGHRAYPRTVDTVPTPGQRTPRLPQDSGHRAYPRTVDTVPTPGQWTPCLPQKQGSGHVGLPAHSGVPATTDTPCPREHDTHSLALIHRYQVQMGGRYAAALSMWSLCSSGLMITSQVWNKAPIHLLYHTT